MPTTTLGQRLRHARESQGALQRDVADACGVTVGAVSQWEADQSQPTLTHLRTVAKYLEVSVAWLLGES